MRKKIRWRWTSIALRGVAAVIFGVLSLVNPRAAIVSLVLLFGVYALIDGLIALSARAAVGSKSRRAVIARGIVSVAAGVITLMWPGLSTFALLFVIGAWAIVAGALEIVWAFRLREELKGEWLLAVEGVLSILFGTVLLISPLAGAIVLGLWVGGYAMVLGTMLLLAAFEVRSFTHRHAAPVYY
jgi:uncharacterized membrane protein HdeD (DUF308 family)